MTREETWERLIELGAVKGGISKGKWNLSEAILDEANLHGANLSEANLSEARLSEANLYGANLSGANLSGARLYGAYLYEANLSGADLHGAYLSEADLSGANLGGADLHGARLSEANLHGADLHGANLSGADLDEAILDEADLHEARLSEARLSEANLSEANLYEANLHGAILIEARLHGANLHGANLYGANLHGADLDEAILDEADLSEANLSGARLYGANLSGANLIEARLYGANLSGANLHGANLTESTLNDVNFNLADLSGVDITGSTFWGVSTAGWRIDHIKAQYVYFCRALDKEREKYRRNFEEGQFEELFKSLPTVELIFEKGLSPSGLFALAALIEKIGGQNPDLGIKMASISKNAFETKVGVNVDKDEHLSEVVQLMQEAMRKDAKGIQAEMLVPLLSQMFPEWGATLVEALQKQPTPLFINYHYEPTYNIITSNGESGPITQYGNVQSGGNVFINYKQNKEEINRLFAKLKEAFGAYEASMRHTLVETTDNMIEAIRKGKEVERIQGYWEQIKEGIKTGAGVTTVAMNLVPHVARLLGLVP